MFRATSDPMSTRLNDAMSRLNMEGTRASFGFGAKPPPSPGAKRNSGLDPSTINSLFPDAAAAIAKQKADFKEHTGNTPTSSRVAKPTTRWASNRTIENCEGAKPTTGSTANASWWRRWWTGPSSSSATC